MLKDQALGVLVDVRYPRTWREYVDVAIEELKLEEGPYSWKRALWHILEPI